MITTGVIAAVIAFAAMLLSIFGMAIKITLWMAEIRGDVKELKKDVAEDHQTVKGVPLIDQRVRIIERRLKLTSPYRDYHVGPTGEEDEQ